MPESDSEDFERYIIEQSQSCIDFLEEFVSDGYELMGLEVDAEDAFAIESGGQISVSSESGDFRFLGGSRDILSGPAGGVTGGADGLLYHENLRLLDEYKYDIPELELDELRLLGKHLTDVIMKPDTRLGGLGPDHLAYWAWTADFAHYTLIEQQEREEYRLILLDFETLIDFVSLSFRDIMHPQIPTSLMTSGLRFVGGAGFPLLEGLIRRRCEEVSLDGSVQFESEDKQVEVAGRQREGPINNDREAPLQLDHLLHIWMKSGATEEVKQLLEDIDGGYEPGQIGKKFPDADTDKFSEGFFRVLFDQRNYNLHGEGSTQTVGAVILNLCCMVIWDFLNQAEYADAGVDFHDETVLEAYPMRYRRLIRGL